MIYLFIKSGIRQLKNNFLSIFLSLLDAYAAAFISWFDHNVVILHSHKATPSPLVRLGGLMCGLTTLCIISCSTILQKVLMDTLLVLGQKVLLALNQ